MIRYKNRFNNNKIIVKMNKLDINNRSNVEEILNLIKIFKYSINNYKYVIIYIDMEGNLTLEDKE